MNRGNRGGSAVRVVTGRFSRRRAIVTGASRGIGAGVAERLAVAAAMPKMPSLHNRRISPHTIRHTTAMHLLQSGESIEGIALWLGHESPTTTHQYVEANLAMKEKALAKLQDPDTLTQRFKATDSLLEFLKTL